MPFHWKFTTSNKTQKVNGKNIQQMKFVRTLDFQKGYIEKRLI